MNLKEFFNQERKRVFTPGPYFTPRVMTRLNGGHRVENGLWELIPSSVRPVLALAIVLIISFVAVELFFPPVPQRGMIEASFEAEQRPGESLIYGEEDELPAGQELLEQLIALEEGQ
jgi:hypothetical protein